MPDVPPHFPATPRFRGGRWLTVDQDSGAHVSECAEVVLRTPAGTMEFDPELGLADLVGTVGAVTPVIAAALRKYVPQRDMLIREDVDMVNERIRNVATRLAPTQDGEG